MKNLSKVISILLIMVLVLTMASTIVMAANPMTPSEVDPASGTASIGSIKNLGNSIVQILSTIGIIISVAVLVVLGIKYMMGSAEEKAEYKKTLLPYIIGAALVFAASTIAQVVYNFTVGISA